MMGKIICIDPGHGGKDPGGGSNDKFLEKDMVLDISKEQKKHFERNGIKVFMTRTTDTYIDSVSRTNLVKQSGAKYCISNHINAFNVKAEGAETIHSVFADSKIAEGILKELVALGAKYRRYFSKRNDSGGDWYFMHRLTGSVNTVIVEYGFADNKSDTDKIIKNWKEYAEAVARYYIEHVFNQKYIAEGKEDASKPSKPADKPKPSKPTTTSKDTFLIRVKVNDLHTYTKADWSAKKGAPMVNKGEIFTVVETLTVNGYKMYKLKSGWYITAAKQYVEIHKPSASTPKPRMFKAGQKVKIKSSAKKYATGQAIPARYKNKTYTIQQVKGDRALIKELVSWVYIKDLQ